MLEEVAIAIDLLKQPATIERAAGGSYVSGTWVGAYDASASISGVLEPVTGRDLKDMPEGIRSEASALFFVNITDGSIAENDRVTADAVPYRVLQVAPWSRYGGFHECVLGKIKTP